MTENLIKAVNLQKIYYLSREVTVTALQNINLTVAKGEFVAIMGPSGSGKSTLMQVLGCLDRQTAGDYYLDGVNIFSLSDDELAFIRSQKIGFVFQQFNLLPRMTALENVALPLLYVGKGREVSKAKEALAVVGLLDRAEHWPNQLSGGQQQRVAIARALVNEPEIILADEPTGALDTKAGSEVMSLLKDLNEKGKTVVLITHEPYIAKQAQRIITLRDGQIVSDELQARKKVK